MKYPFRKCLAFSISFFILSASLVGCGTGENEAASENYTLLDVASPGNYTNVLDGRSDYLEFTEDGKLALKEFDENELVSFYGEAMQNENITEEQFLSLLHNPYDVTVEEDDIEGCYRIALPLLGADVSMKLILNYDSELQIITFHGCDYQKAETQSEENAVQ